MSPVRPSQMTLFPADTDSMMKNKACDVCTGHGVFFSAIFPDGAIFDLCEGCTNDLVRVVESSFTFPVIIVAAVSHDDGDETDRYCDPAEIDYL